MVWFNWLACNVTPVFGCGDVIVDERLMRVTRSGDELHVECVHSHVVHTLVCRLNEWIGQFNCSTHSDTGCRICISNIRLTLTILQCFIYILIGWLCGVVVRTLDLRLLVADSIPSHDV